MCETRLGAGWELGRKAGPTQALGLEGVRKGDRGAVSTSVAPYGHRVKSKRLSPRCGPAPAGSVAPESNRPGAATLLKLYNALGLRYLTCQMGTATICQSFFSGPPTAPAPGGVPQKAAMCCHPPS